MQSTPNLTLDAALTAIRYRPLFCHFFLQSCNCYRCRSIAVWNYFKFRTLSEVVPFSIAQHSRARPTPNPRACRYATPQSRPQPVYIFWARPPAYCVLLHICRCIAFFCIIMLACYSSFYHMLSMEQIMGNYCISLQK